MITGDEDDRKKTQGQTINMVARPIQERHRKKRKYNYSCT
jgi:hypothetical protein